MEPARNPDSERDDAASPGSVSDNPVILDYEARRCHVCQCKYPSFGFGPPLTTKGQTLWACFEHRGVVDRLLTGGPAMREEPGQSSLF